MLILQGFQNLEGLGILIAWIIVPKINGTFEYANNALVVTPQYDLSKIDGTITLTAKYAPADLEYNYDLETYTLY